VTIKGCDVFKHVCNANVSHSDGNFLFDNRRRLYVEKGDVKNVNSVNKLEKE
jgi:hypothetical protein